MNIIVMQKRSTSQPIMMLVFTKVNSVNYDVQESLKHFLRYLICEHGAKVLLSTIFNQWCKIVEVCCHLRY